MTTLISLEQGTNFMEPENQSPIQKNKKEIIIIIVITIIFLLIVGILFFLKKKNQTNNGVGTIPNKSESGSLYSNINNNPNTNIDNQNTNTSDSDYIYYREGLIKVWDRPVAGYGFYDKNSSYTYQDSSGNTVSGTRLDTILIFVDSDTGFIYQKNLSEATSTPTQITKSLYPNTREAYFLNIKGQNKVLLQYSSNNIIKSVLANIPDYYSVSNNLENIVNLDNNITNISISPDFSKAVYLVVNNKTTNNKKDIYSDWYVIGSSGVAKIFTSDLSSWKLQITNNSNVYAYNSDTAIENSPLYKLNTNTASLEQIYVGHTGSSYLVGDNSLLTSAFTSSGLRIYNDQNFYGGFLSDNSLTALNFNTLTNKCSLNIYIICGVPKEIKSYDSGLPDAWYQGLTSWQDNLYIVNSDYPYGQLLFDLNIDGGVSDDFDIRNVEITKDRNHLLFINKNDGSLWSLNIGNILNTGTGD